jgi:hypothetical protein
VTIAKRPSVWAGMAADREVICAKWEQKYFCGEDWTSSISLNRFSKFVLPVMPKKHQANAINAQGPLSAIRLGFVGIGTLARRSNQSIRNAIYICNANR